MNISVDEKQNIITVPAEYLASFARTRSSRTKLFFAETDRDPEDDGKISGENIPLSFTVSEDGVSFVFRGVADAVYHSGVEWIMEKEYRRGRLTSRSKPSSDPSCMAESVVIAHMLCEEKKADSIRVRIVLTSDNGDCKAFENTLSASFLKNMTDALFSRALPFIEIETEKAVKGIPSLAELPFPYKTIRDAQREFITEAYREMKRGENLIVSAPTGVGKTVSALYPALRAIGSGIADKVFYLTAKTVTGNAASEAVRLMSASVPALKCVTVLAKERVCPRLYSPRKNGVSLCRFCPLTGEAERVPYEERRDAALIEVLKNYKVIDSETVCAAAKKYDICPYELSLDLSEYTEVVICDYNYVFDPQVRFRRYFSEKNDGKYIFLIDEAHNLPDRAREMYSATLDTAGLIKAYKIINEQYANIKPLADGIASVVKKLKELSELCRIEERELPGGITSGYYISREIPKNLPEVLSQYVRAANTAIKAHEELSDLLESSVMTCGDFIKSTILFDKGFTFWAQTVNGRLKVRSVCLDPAPMLRKMMSSSVSSVLFSATLSPIDYFADICGCAEAVTLELDSPYEKENLCLFAVDSVSTRYADRENFADDIAEIISAAVQPREGNYIVYFPSYEYMKTVYEAFLQSGCDVRTAVQSKGMSHAERNAFLNEFSENKKGTLVGFCVLGGAFAEGVDLKGEKLIGTVIVGTGLPKITEEQNILRDYFEMTRENGTDYAYTYPAMIKVLQAVGRVIRSENDRGIAVLVDDRYSDPSVYRLFPKSWRHIKYTSDPYTLSEALERFWNNER